ncbi:hypothetical protein [Curtobacterium sp. Leaf261]|uniref:hypothetical protein n=1 Tax=Curtobacterium sp. Leaf261 TaxID=1736311 RepID=UPI0006F85BC9|nr:hypothetical protein [Curtobacterium sp. Leaf261]KQO64888.1 hypothetical protein ASF23_01545 [Curtobacterium sp. Leaf261]
MTADSDALDRAARDQYDGGLHLVHTTVSDEDGDGFPAADVDRWEIDVRVPVRLRGRSELVAVASVTAFTILSPEDLDDVGQALGESEVDPRIGVALAAPDAENGGFLELFDSAASLLNLPDLLVIGHVAVRAPFHGVDDLVADIVSAVQDGPAGRAAAFVVVAPSGWDVEAPGRTTSGRLGVRQPTDRQRSGDRSSVRDQLEEDGFTAWAGTDVLVAMNADPEAAAELVEERLADGDAVIPFPQGARTDELWLADLVEQAMTGPSVPVPMDLPPTLPDTVVAGVPDDIHGLDADEDTGALSIHTHDAELEVVGRPGNAPQLVGVATESSAATQAWLREVHTRYWQYWPELHDQIHVRVEQAMDGTLDPAADEDTPHLHIPRLTPPEAPWPGDGEVELDLVGDDDGDPRTFEALQVTSFGHEHIGAVTIHDSGHIVAFLHDEWNPEFAEHEAAVTHLLALGADQFIADVLHVALEDGCNEAILTGRAPGH